MTDSQLDVSSLLARLTPLDQLDAEQRTALARSAQTEDLIVGQVVNAGDRRQRLVYLVAGEVILQRSEGAPQLLQPGAVKRPVFEPEDNGARIIARHPSKLLLLDRVLYQRLRSGLTGSAEVREVDAAGEEVQLIYALFNAYREGQLEVPSLPEVALRIRDAASDPDIGVADIAEIVQHDPALTVRLIQAANSPALRGYRGITSVRDAVVRLGLTVTRELALFLSLRSLFETDSPVIHQHMSNLYDHSNRIAAICHVLAGRIRGFEPERALLAGLVHDIGIIPILNFVNARSRNIPSAVDLDHAIANLRGVVGGMVLGQWGFDPELVKVAEGAEEWERDSGKADYCDLVLMAQLFDNAIDPHPANAALPAPEAVPAYRALGLDALEQEGGREAFLAAATLEIAQVEESLA